ncbi:MAG: hypothetical protein HF976_01635 [ANME-2 cluster archaeon]|nr:hypothetical protein [ANME-2 cluster archaeon]MBC2700110.1 hypothetical protein [ANME-2 cluster archaeon]MBC2708792.1 hypothetical protein [ANME-2 cluster archaeon]MBC2748248.1 hypothetical protein [ANME-2 cluster archaeon]
MVGDHTVMLFGYGECIKVRHQAGVCWRGCEGCIVGDGVGAGVYGMADVLGLGK